MVNSVSCGVSLVRAGLTVGAALISCTAADPDQSNTGGGASATAAVVGSRLLQQIALPRLVAASPCTERSCTSAGPARVWTPSRRVTPRRCARCWRRNFPNADRADSLRRSNRPAVWTAGMDGQVTAVRRGGRPPVPGRRARCARRCCPARRGCRAPGADRAAHPRRLHRPKPALHADSRSASSGDVQSAALTLIDGDSAVAGPVERDVAAFLAARLLDEDRARALV
jgi:hypothetical protein